MINVFQVIFARQRIFPFHPNSAVVLEKKYTLGCFILHLNLQINFIIKPSVPLGKLTKMCDFRQIPIIMKFIWRCKSKMKHPNIHPIKHAAHCPKLCWAVVQLCRGSEKFSTKGIFLHNNPDKMQCRHPAPPMYGCITWKSSFPFHCHHLYRVVIRR